MKASLERARANPQTVSPTDNTALTQLQQNVEDLKAKIQELENQPGPSTSPELRDAQDEVRRLKASLERARANPQTVSPTDNTALTQLQQNVEDLKAKIAQMEQGEREAAPGHRTATQLKEELEAKQTQIQQLQQAVGEAARQREMAAEEVNQRQAMVEQLTRASQAAMHQTAHEAQIYALDVQHKADLQVQDFKDRLEQVQADFDQRAAREATSEEQNAALIHQANALTRLLQGLLKDAEDRLKAANEQLRLANQQNDADSPARTKLERDLARAQAEGATHEKTAGARAKEIERIQALLKAAEAKVAAKVKLQDDLREATARRRSADAKLFAEAAKNAKARGEASTAQAEADEAKIAQAYHEAEATKHAARAADLTSQMQASTSRAQQDAQTLATLRAQIASMERRARTAAPEGGGAAQTGPETTQPEPAIATNSEPPRTDATNPSGARGYDDIDTFSSGAADGAHSDTITGTDAASHVSDAESVANDPNVAGTSEPAATAVNAPVTPTPPGVSTNLDTEDPAYVEAVHYVEENGKRQKVTDRQLIDPMQDDAPAAPQPADTKPAVPQPAAPQPARAPNDGSTPVTPTPVLQSAPPQPTAPEPASEPAAPEPIAPQATALQTTAPPAPQPEPQPPAAPQATQPAAPQPPTQPPAQSAAFHPGSAHSDTATGTDPGGGTSTDAENAVEASAVSAPAIGVESDIYSDIELALSTDPSVSGLGSVQLLTDSVDLALREVAGIDQPDAIARALRAVAADLEQDNTQGIFEPGNPDDVDPDQMDDIPVASAVHGDANEYLPEAEEEGASENEYIPDAEKEDAPENEDLPDAEEEVSENEDLPDASERQEDVQKKRSKRLLEKRRKNNRVAKAVAAYEAVAMTGPRSRATVQPINITKAGGVNKGRRHARQALIERVLRAFPAEDQRPSAFDGPF